MTKSEAMEMLNTFPEEDEMYGAAQMAIKALEKQIPKKPDRWKSGYACCYSCKRGIVREDNYCCYCGQKLDWSDEE